MTTILGARDELAAALTSGGVPIADAPGGMSTEYGVIFGDGIDLTHVGRGQVQPTFRVTLIAGGWETQQAGRALTGMVQSTLAVLKALDGWQLGEVRRDNVIAIAGGQMLGCDVTASRMVDI